MSLIIRSNFNPRSPHGERLYHGSNRIARVEFQSTLPARGATQVHRLHAHDVLISIHAPRTGSDVRLVGVHRQPEAISIHAPRTGSDETLLGVKSEKGDFNPRSPHGERQQGFKFRGIDDVIFQSTLPARGATGTTSTKHTARIFQSTLPARGATEAQRPCCARADISIHAPRTGSDSLDAHNQRAMTFISIHAPRTGSDKCRSMSPINEDMISIHAPRTGSDASRSWKPTRRNGFQSTLPARGATDGGRKGADGRGISIHAPRTGSDQTG